MQQPHWRSRAADGAGDADISDVERLATESFEHGLLYTGPRAAAAQAAVVSFHTASMANERWRWHVYG